MNESMPIFGGIITDESDRLKPGQPFNLTFTDSGTPDPAAAAELRVRDHMDALYAKRSIPHEEAREIAQRLIHSHFGTQPQARASIPANPNYDDDLLIVSYIRQRQSADVVARVGFEQISRIVDSADDARFAREIAINVLKLILPGGATKPIASVLDYAARLDAAVAAVTPALTDFVDALMTASQAAHEGRFDTMECGRLAVAAVNRALNVVAERVQEINAAVVGVKP